MSTTSWGTSTVEDVYFRTTLRDPRARAASPNCHDRQCSGSDGPCSCCSGGTWDSCTDNTASCSTCVDECHEKMVDGCGHCEESACSTCMSSCSCEFPPGNAAHRPSHPWEQDGAVDSADALIPTLLFAALPPSVRLHNDLSPPIDNTSVLVVAKPPPPLSYVTRYDTHQLDESSATRGEHPPCAYELRGTIAQSVDAYCQTAADDTTERSPLRFAATVQTATVGIQCDHHTGAANMHTTAVNTEPVGTADVAVGASSPLELLECSPAVANMGAPTNVTSAHDQLLEELIKTTTVTPALPIDGVKQTSPTCPSAVESTTDHLELAHAQAARDVLTLFQIEETHRQCLVDMQDHVWCAVLSGFMERTAQLEMSFAAATQAVRDAVANAKLQMQQQQVLGSEEFNHRCVLWEDMRSDAVRLWLDWSRVIVGQEVSAARAATAELEFEIRRARNEAMRSECAALKLERQVQLMRTARVAAATVDFHSGADVDREDCATPVESMNVPLGTLQNAGHHGDSFGAANRASLRHQPRVSASAGRTVLHHVELNVPVHERFARAHRVANDNVTQRQSHT